MDVEVGLMTSPVMTTSRRILEHAIHTEDTKNDNTWKSCCLLMDKRAVQYFTQITVISSVMAFCIYQLATNETCEAQVSFMGLLTLAIGILVPSPKFK